MADVTRLNPHRLATLVLAATLCLAYSPPALPSAASAPTAITRATPGAASPPGPGGGPGAGGFLRTLAGQGLGGGPLAAPERLSQGLSPQATRDLLRMVAPPVRDESDLVRRFKNACGTLAERPVPLQRNGTVGELQSFWVLDEPNRRFFQAQSTLQYASPHLLFYVQDGIQVSTDALAASAAVFEQQTYPLLRQYFGDLPEDARITIFNGRVPGVSGYFSASDLYPRSVNPFSNERVMVFMSLDGMRPGTAAYDSVLAHEAQHFVHWVVKPQQDSWINEGASELAMALAGYDQSGAARRYLNVPETQLNAWAEHPWQALPHYGGGYLILEYFAQRLGGYEQVKGLISAPGTSVQTFESYLAAQAGTLSFDDLFRDFAIANLINDAAVADGRFGYQRLPTLRAQTQETQTAYPATSVASLRPYATRYVELQPGTRSGDLELRFSGAGEVPLFGAPPRSGRVQWWGNGADEMESTLTREIDLSAVSQATLRFATWFSTEQHYDYAGVAVSTDEGCTWQTIPGQYTTDSNPVGQNLGHGFTGRSGDGGSLAWVDETMDLTPYAGRKILLRFFYVTDQSYHGPGFAVDDVTIPEIGLADDAETDQGWEARGFLRSVNATALEWAVQVVAFTESGPQIRQMPLSGGGDAGPAQGILPIRRFGTDVRRVVVAISPLVPVTLEGADFRLEATVR